MASGIDPVLIRTESVLEGPYGHAVRDSLAAASLAAASLGNLETHAEEKEKEDEYH
jgi:hypothetical protein